MGHYKPSIKVMDLDSHTIYAVCMLISCMSDGSYSLKVDFERQNF